ncbi:MAG: SdpI family protein [Chitinophagaceae bacterium]
MKLKRISTVLVIVFVSLPYLYAIYLYPNLAEKIPTHFNASGQADAWGSKNSIFMMPIIMSISSLLVYFLLTNIEKIDPKRASGLGNETIKAIGLFMVASLNILSLVLLYGISHQGTPIDKLIFGALGILFGGMGYFMPRLKQNYFAGFKLAWTLDNETNWNRTHQLAGKLWMGGGMLAFVLASIFQGTSLFIGFMSCVAIMTIVPIVYSYLLYKKGNPSA